MKNQEEKLFSDIVLYTAETGDVKVEVLFSDETFWLSQKRMAELFGVEVHTINYHLKEIYASGELKEEATIRKIRIVQKEMKVILIKKLIKLKVGLKLMKRKF